MLAQELTPEQIQDLESWLHQISDDVKYESASKWQLCGWDFHVEDSTPLGGNHVGLSRHFGISVLRYRGVVTNAGNRLNSAFGFFPKRHIQIHTYCSSTADYQIMHLLTLRLAEKYNGIIDFNGALYPPDHLLPFQRDVDYWQRNWSDFAPAFEEWIKDMPGKIVGIEYEVGNGRRWVSHKADIEFFRAMFQHPNQDD